MKRALYFLPILFLAAFFGVQPAAAVCPICTIAVGAGVGLSRWLGIDDAIAGLWIGGLTVSLIAWTINWLEKKNYRFPGRNWLTAVAYYLMVIVPLYFTGLIDHPWNTICACGADKLLLGIVAGSLGFWTGAEWYYFLKNRNGGRANFLFQKVVMPVAPLAILSLIFYFLTNN